jgi:hypothetical protein
MPVYFQNYTAGGDKTQCAFARQLEIGHAFYVPF